MFVLSETRVVVTSRTTATAQYTSNGHSVIIKLTLQDSQKKVFNNKTSVAAAAPTLNVTNGPAYHSGSLSGSAPGCSTTNNPHHNHRVLPAHNGHQYVVPYHGNHNYNQHNGYTNTEQVPINYSNSTQPQKVSGSDSNCFTNNSRNYDNTSNSNNNLLYPQPPQYHHHSNYHATVSTTHPAPQHNGNEQQHQPPCEADSRIGGCCVNCGDFYASEEFLRLFRPEDGPDLTLAVVSNGQRVNMRIPRRYFGNTRYLRVFLKPGMPLKPLTFSVNDVCRRHTLSKCGSGSSCKFLHICPRVWGPLAMSNSLNATQLSGRSVADGHRPQRCASYVERTGVESVTAPLVE